MNKFSYHVLLTSVLLALSVGANAEAKAAPTRLTTDPAITEKAIAEEKKALRDFVYNNSVKNGENQSETSFLKT